MYVREPHPGEHYPAHQTFEQKLGYASVCAAADDIQTRVVVDDLDGTMHQAYGTMPNMLYIVDRAGVVVYKALWTDHADVARALANLLWAAGQRAAGQRLKASYVERMEYLPADLAEGLRERVFERAGPQASRDHASVFGKPG